MVTGCTPQGGRSRCTVPRRLLQLYRQMEIWVSATNALGMAESEHLCLDPMDVGEWRPELPALRRGQGPGKRIGRERGIRASLKHVGLLGRISQARSREERLAGMNRCQSRVTDRAVRAGGL